MVYAKYVYAHCFKLIYLLIRCLISIEDDEKKNMWAQMMLMMMFTCVNEIRLKLILIFNYTIKTFSGGVNSLSAPNHKHWMHRTHHKRTIREQ